MSNAASRSEAARLSAAFIKAGAQPVETAILQPAETLLDLYGEDIRARAYVTDDPLRGERMLRPDFTVPVVQMHMKEGKEPARYTYSGEVFRRQEEDETRATEFLQVGFELFSNEDVAAADAEVFSLIASALSPLPLRMNSGDIGILRAAVAGLKTSAARRDALMRHIWRPRRFRALLDRYAGTTPVPPARVALLADAEPLPDPKEIIGKRTLDEIGARITALHKDAALAPISAEELALIEAVLALKASSPDALSALRDIAVDMPAIEVAVSRFSARLSALEKSGIDLDALQFEGSYGRTSMEYYDGFVFGFYAENQHGQPPLASGGRYDALTRVLGNGSETSAVGAVVRPELVAKLRGAPT